MDSNSEHDVNNALWKQWSDWQNQWQGMWSPAQAKGQANVNPQDWLDANKLRAQVEQMGHIESWLQWQLTALSNSKKLLSMQLDALESMQASIKPKA